ncbi:SDR family NAD(P)-dependent oxidoreductase [Pseudomaricurvus sp.]|uniref:SDR family NAD(P)-dependent oxidoreductase n=1 Tax=Pseudomaricurvus sp. TaxID=2004510 RepID=UPI003F6AE434
MPTPSNMNGKVAIVTGAASGVGRATALFLAKAGAKLAIVDVNAEALESTAEELRNLKTEVLTLPVDLSDTRQCQTIVDKTVDTFGRVDALCNVAGVFLPTHTTDMSDDAVDLTLSVNLSAPFKLIRAAIPHLIEHQGAVVNVSSCSAHPGQAYLALYSATKAALNQLTKSLAMEYMHKGIRVNSVSPGGMMTPLAAGMRNLQDPDPTLMGRIAPLRGLVEVDDVAEMVAFLATDAAKGYHGAIINIDNGITAG